MSSSDQRTTITGTKTEPAFIRKHNRSPLRPPRSFELTPVASLSRKKKLSLQGDLNLLQNLSSGIIDVLTDDFSDEEVPANNLLELSFDSVVVVLWLMPPV
ncbi:hypothetical protein TNCV_2556451 [Trichonephila clavipes]|nr:hypothetical protein TNCV_2556451 [Trichonephila clavipes]